MSDLDFRIQTSESVSGPVLLHRTLIWSQMLWILTSRGPKFRKNDLEKLCLLSHCPLLVDFLIVNTSEKASVNTHLNFWSLSCLICLGHRTATSGRIPHISGRLLMWSGCMRPGFWSAVPWVLCLRRQPAATLQQLYWNSNQKSATSCEKKNYKGSLSPYSFDIK